MVKASNLPVRVINKNKILKYGLKWERTVHPAAAEMLMIQHGGRWKNKRTGQMVGEGLEHHYRKFCEAVWPNVTWNRWRERMLKEWVNHTYMGIMGCASAGKTDSMGMFHLAYWYAFSDCCTILVSSTTTKELELRVWGTIKKYHNEAKRNCPWLPGVLIESKQMIIADEHSEGNEGRDFKNGICAVACRRGNSFVGLSSYAGIHNKHVLLLADELNLMPKALLDSTSNLSKCQHFKMTGLGNPNETTNSHGILCEPATELGGWESGIDQSGGTKSWRTNFPNGVCLQLPGSDSPNLDVGPDEPIPFPYLMTRKQMEDDGKIWGKEDWHYTMMNEARMPRGQGAHRVITRQACERGGALLEPIWRDTRIQRITFCDAAFKGSGGDRCVYGELNFGYEAEGQTEKDEDTGAIVFQNHNAPQGRQIIALIDLITIPIVDNSDKESEDQIVEFCMKENVKRGVTMDDFWYDAGMKTTLVTAFSRLAGNVGNSVDFGGSPSQLPVSAEIDTPCDKYYSKFVTELWYSFRYCVEARQFRGLTKDAMWEFSSREWKQTSGNKIEVESKGEMKQKTGRSPDLADAIVTGLYGARKSGFIIARLAKEPDEDDYETEQWKRDLREKARKSWNKGNLDYAA